MFDLDPIGAMFLIIAVLFSHRRRRIQTCMTRLGTNLGTRSRACAGHDSAPILRCSTATNTSSAVVGQLQASHTNSYHHGI